MFEFKKKKEIQAYRYFIRASRKELELFFLRGIVSLWQRRRVIDFLIINEKRAETAGKARREV